MSSSMTRLFERLRPAVIIDNGTTYTKSKICQDDMSIDREITFFGIKPEYKDRPENEIANFVIPGDEALKSASIELIFPVSEKTFKNIYLLSSIWEKLFFDKLKIAPSRRPIILLMSIRNPTDKQLEAVRVLFEDFDFAVVGLLYNELSSLFATGQSTGVVVDLGDGGISIAPFYNGFLIKHAIWYLPITGIDIDRYLCRLLVDKGYSFDSRKDLFKIRNIKEKYCYVAPDLKKEEEMYQRLGKKLAKKYQDRDLGEITLLEERYLAAEVLFNPALINIKSVPLDEAIVESIESCLVSIRPELYKNILLTGGLSLFKGLGDRIRNEILRKNDHVKDVSVVTPKNSDILNIIGANKACVVKEALDLWITRSEFKKDRLITKQKIEKMSLFR